MTIQRILLAVVLASTLSVTACTGPGDGKRAEPEIIKSEVSRVIRAPRERVYAIVADVTRHDRLLANVRGREILPKGDLAQRVTRPNETITLSVAIEPTDRLAIARFQFFPPDRIVEHMITNPFDEPVEVLDRKRGKITYMFESVPEGTRFTAQSEFIPSTGRFYNRAWVDGIWNQFLDRLERLATQP